MAKAPGDSPYPTVGIVVLTWENYEEASECIESIESISYPDYRLFVVDNGSEDGSIERLQEEYEWPEFVLNEENLGFARGNNPGIERALDEGVDYVLLLNDDTIVTESFLEPLVETIEANDDAAIVGGVINDAETGEIHNAGFKLWPWAAAKARMRREPKRDGPYRVGYVQSCLALVDPAFLESVGLLNGDYFIGMEDVDLAWKARRRGWEVLTTPESEIYHRVGVTTETSPFMLYHRTRNKLRFAAENMNNRQRALFYLSFVGILLFSYGRWLLGGDSKKIKATLVGAANYFGDGSINDEAI
jgi:GT2 family glycosyltransferase